MQALSRPDLETPSMVWARIQAAQQAQRPDSPPPAPPPPISGSASGVWAQIMAVRPPRMLCNSDCLPAAAP